MQLVQNGKELRAFYGTEYKSSECELKVSKQYYGSWMSVMQHAHDGVMHQR